jgi:predicted restriction endonuclease
MKNDDNRISNIILLCPIHHREAHDKRKVVEEKDILGRVIKHRVVSKKRSKEIKKSRKNKPIWEIYN